MSVVSHRLPITVDWQRISADNIYAPAAIHMNALKTGMFSNKSSGKQSQDLCLGNISHQTDIQKPVLIPGAGAKSYPLLTRKYRFSREVRDTPTSAQAKAEGESMAFIQAVTSDGIPRPLAKSFPEPVGI